MGLKLFLSQAILGPSRGNDCTVPAWKLWPMLRCTDMDCVDLLDYYEAGDASTVKCDDSG